MTEKKPTKAHRHESSVSSIFLRTSEYWGLTLGELRLAVEAAHDLADDAEVTFEETRAHYSRRDRILAKAIRIRQEKSA